MSQDEGWSDSTGIIGRDEGEVGGIKTRKKKIKMNKEAAFLWLLHPTTCMASEQEMEKYYLLPAAKGECGVIMVLLASVCLSVSLPE